MLCCRMPCLTLCIRQGVRSQVHGPLWIQYGSQFVKQYTGHNQRCNMRFILGMQVSVGMGKLAPDKKQKEPEKDPDQLIHE